MIKPVYFEYPGNFAFLNAGAGDVVIESVSLDLSAQTIELPIAQLVKPGQVMFINIPPQYEEPKDIKGATWVRGEAPSSLISEALDIGKPQRCAVFHVFNAEHPFLKNMNTLDPEQKLTVKAASASLNIYHISTKTSDRIEMREAKMAFLKTGTCSR